MKRKRKVLIFLAGLSFVLMGSLFVFKQEIHAEEVEEQDSLITYVGELRRMSMQPATIKEFLKNSLEAVGNVMYIYGGGWNEADNGSGEETVTMGLSETWVFFRAKQNANYYHKNYNYKQDVSVIHLGLDCSGYVGWALYNTFQTGNHQVGYVDYASDIGDNLERLGLGHVREIGEITDYRPGDIMTNSGHIWIVLGQCEDGSVVLLHASPPGVQISGTTTRAGSYNSMAISLATEYMSRYYPEWYRLFPDSSRGSSYLTDYRQFRFFIGEMMSDPEGYLMMSVEDVLNDLFWIER